MSSRSPYREVLPSFLTKPGSTGFLFFDHVAGILIPGHIRPFLICFCLLFCFKKPKKRTNCSEQLVVMQDETLLILKLFVKSLKTFISVIVHKKRGKINIRNNMENKKITTM